MLNNILSAHRISIIIPTLNEERGIAACIDSLQYLRNKGHELIVVDGGSRDKTCELIKGKVDVFSSALAGRAMQMHQGTRRARGDVYLFLHADTFLPAGVDALLQQSIDTDLAWGRFDVELTGRQLLFRIIEYCMNLRSRLTGIATGDQAMFVTRKLYELAKGFPAIALMEDIALSSSLKQHKAPICIREKVLTSSRRWEEHGILRTVFKMWYLRLRYAIGVSPATLADDYD